MATSESSQSSKIPLVKQIAERVLEFDSKSITSEAALHSKALILDSIGCALAAGGEHAYKRALRTFETIGGNSECTIIGSKHRMPVTSAVMLNGILIRELDLNDAYVGPGQMGHPSDNVAVALSVGEKRQASGLDVVASVIAGYELYCRIQDIIVDRGPWDHVTASALAAPAIAGRLLKLDANQLANALALSAAHGNTLSAVRSGQLSNAKAMANAFVAYHATICTMLASQGATGPLSIFEGKGGLNQAFLAGADLNLLREPIRDHFRISDVSIKAYPCIGTAQSMVAAALQARAGIADPVKGAQAITEASRTEAIKQLTCGTISGRRKPLAPRWTKRWSAMATRSRRCFRTARSPTISLSKKGVQTVKIATLRDVKANLSKIVKKLPSDRSVVLT
jgi:2-methylcitrate dehydratase